MGVIGIGVGTATMGRICRDKDGTITEQSTARWDADPAGGSVAIWPMDPEKMEPSGPAEVYGDWDAAAYLRRVVELIHPNRRINIPDLEAMIRADMEAVGLYSPMFDPTIRQLAKSERELSRAEKTWKAAGGQMVAELVNKTGGKYTAKDPHYAVVDQLRKDILALRSQLGLTPSSFARAKKKRDAFAASAKSPIEELLEAADAYAVEHASQYGEEVDRYVAGVLSGDLNVNVEIRQACQRYVDDLRNPAWEFRPEPANAIIAIIETTMCHQQGQFLDATPLRGTPFYLLPYHPFCLTHHDQTSWSTGYKRREMASGQFGPEAHCVR